MGGGLGTPSRYRGRVGEGECSRARELRANPTTAERTLWRLLFTFRTNGYHFRKQAPIGPYFADFACKHAGLIIEVDGETHGTAVQVVKDSIRTAFLASRGFDVLRFSNADVLTNADGVYAKIADALKDRPKNLRSRRATPSPTLPLEGEGDPTAGISPDLTAINENDRP